MSHTFEVTPTDKELAGIKAITGRKDETEAIAELVALAGNQQLARYPFSRPLDAFRLRPPVRKSLERDQKSGAIRQGKRFKTARDAIAYLKTIK